MGLHMAIAHKVDSLNKVFVGKRLVGASVGASGITTPVTTNSTVLLDDPNMFGGDKKEGGVYGNLDLEFGETTQTQNPYLISQLGANVPAFRGVTCAVFRGAEGYSDTLNIRQSYSNPNGGGYLAAMSPYPKAWAFEVTNIPAKTLNLGKEDINSGSANGAHIAYEALTNTDWGLGHSPADLNTTGFIDASDTLYDENFGLSLIYANQSSMEKFLQQILTHVNAVMYPERETNKITFKLIRDDYDINTLDIYDETNIRSLEFFERPAFAELVNEVVISYRKRGNLTDSSITVQDLASVQAQGAVISQTIKYQGVDSEDIAAKVGMRELKQSSTPLARARIVVNRSGWDVKPGDVIKLSWAAYGAEEVVMRVIDANYGTLKDRVVRLDLIEDIFGLPANSYITPLSTDWTDEVVGPTAGVSQALIEVPYFVIQTQLTTDEIESLGDDEALIQSVIELASSASFNVQLYTKIGAGDYEFAEEGEPSPTAKITATLDRSTKLSIAINDIRGSLGSVEIGTYAYLNDEVVRVDALDLSLNTVDLGRGYFDTIPVEHAADSVIYFADLNSPIDPIEYADNDTVDGKVLTQTSLGVLPLENATELSITLTGRQNRPYNAANILIAGLSFPTVLTDLVAISVTWGHQDRTQQLVPGGSDWFETALGAPETGVTYTVRFYEDDLNTLWFTDDNVSGTISSFTPPTVLGVATNVRVEVESVRDGILCHQVFSHVFSYTKALGVRTLPNGDVRTLPNLDRRVLP